MSASAFKHALEKFNVSGTQLHNALDGKSAASGGLNVAVLRKLAKSVNHKVNQKTSRGELEDILEPFSKSNHTTRANSPDDINALTKSEVQFLDKHEKELSNLVKSWGYETGPKNVHERYEQWTHEGNGSRRWVQEFTDPVFRTLLVLLRTRQAFYEYDLKPKQLSGIRILERYFDQSGKHSDSEESIMDKLETFLSENELTVQLLLQQRLTADSSKVWTAFITSFRVLVNIAQDQWDTALSRLQNLFS